MMRPSVNHGHCGCPMMMMNDEYVDLCLYIALKLAISVDGTISTMVRQ